MHIIILFWIEFFFFSLYIYIYITDEDKDSIWDSIVAILCQICPRAIFALLCLKKHFISSALLAINNDFVAT